MDDKQKEFNPLAVNILRLQNYTSFFDLSEIVFFEWLMIKASSFKNQHEFYYSVRRIADETKIRKAQLATIIKKFEGLGIITVEKKGMPKCSYFHVNKEPVIALISQIYQFAENGKLLPENGKLLSYFSKLLPETSKHKGTYKEPIKEPKKETSENRKEGSVVVDDSTTSPSSFDNYFDSDHLKALEAKEKKEKEKAAAKKEKEKEQEAKAKEIEIVRLKGLLDKVYAQRVEMYNDGKKKGESIKKITKLAYLSRNEQALYELGQKYDSDQIQYSFSVCVDYFLKDDSEISKLIPYFLSRKPETKDFDTFVTYYNKFLESYYHVKT